MSRADLMPAAFLGHGTPMNALDDNRYTQAWRMFGRSVPRPRAVLVLSAHWYIGHLAVTAMPDPRTIHDFYGFPDELFAVRYPAPGDPAVAQEVADALQPVWVGLDADSWGLDHGAWSVLVHVFPDADVPVLQLSLDATMSFEEHVQLGRRLGSLRERGILVLGSGNVVHNLRRVDFSRTDEGFDWAHRFDEAAREILTTSPGDVLELQAHPDFDKAVPTPDHFLPVLHVAGMALAEGARADVLVAGYAAGSLSMTAYTVGLRLPVPESDDAAPLPPDPPEHTNL